MYSNSRALHLWDLICIDQIDVGEQYGGEDTGLDGASVHAIYT